MIKELEISIGRTEIAPGWVAVIKPVKPIDPVTPGSTARHEAFHTVAALLTGTHVIEASRIPGPGFLGRTILSEFNAISFMAAHAMGCGGTGHDVSVIAWKGHDPNSLAEAARSVLSGHEEEIYTVSSLIESRGTISGNEAKWAMDVVTNPEAEIDIINPLGEKRHFVTRIKKGEGYKISIGIPLENPGNELEEENQPILEDIVISKHPLLNKINLN